MIKNIIKQLINSIDRSPVIAEEIQKYAPSKGENDLLPKEVFCCLLATD